MAQRPDRTPFAEYAKLDAAIEKERLMGLSPTFTLGPFNPAAAREHLRGARLRPEEAALLSRLADIAAEEQQRSLRLEMTEVAAWLPAGSDAAQVMRRLIACRWLWRVPGKHRGGARQPDLYHLTFDLLPGRSTSAPAEARECSGDVRELLRSFQAKPTECPVLGVFARVAGVPAPVRSRTNADGEHRRALRLIDWAVRECVACYYEAIQRGDLAARVRRIPEVRHREAARELISHAAAASNDSRVKAFARHYLRVSTPGAPGYDTRLEDCCAAAFAGAVASTQAKVLKREVKKEASRLLFEMVMAASAAPGAPSAQWPEPGGAPARRRRPPVRSAPEALPEDDGKEEIG